MNKNAKFFLFGILTWIPPYLLSLLFESRWKITLSTLVCQRNLTLLILYKTLSLLLTMGVGAFLLVFYFRSVSGNHFREGLRVGVVWFVLNVLLDMMFVIPKGGINLEAYFINTYLPQVAVGYLALPVMAVAMAYALRG